MIRYHGLAKSILEKHLIEDEYRCPDLQVNVAQGHGSISAHTSF